MQSPMLAAVGQKHHDSRANRESRVLQARFVAVSTDVAISIDTDTRVCFIPAIVIIAIPRQELKFSDELVL